jgi:ABC-2 type transport system ATP-binding protein
MTVDEYLNFVYELKHCKLNREKHLAEICDVVKIKDVRTRVIRNLSKGYRQRVGIAQALIGNPEVIIFDEPTVGLDPKQIIEVRNLIRTLGKNHTVILSTHILPEVQAVCDRIIVINKGKIIADRKTDDITRAVNENRRFKIKICGPQREVLSYLRQKNGILYAEVTTERDGDAYTYNIECAQGTDMRKALFFSMAMSPSISTFSLATRSSSGRMNSAMACLRAAERPRSSSFERLSMVGYIASILST